MVWLKHFYARSWWTICIHIYIYTISFSQLDIDFRPRGLRCIWCSLFPRVLVQVNNGWLSVPTAIPSTASHTFYGIPACAACMSDVYIYIYMCTHTHTQFLQNCPCIKSTFTSYFPWTRDDLWFIYIIFCFTKSRFTRIAPGHCRSMIATVNKSLYLFVYSVSSRNQLVSHHFPSTSNNF